MKINKQLNLVVQVENDNGDIIHVHSTPLLRETFNQYFLVMSKAFSAIYGEGLGAISGPRIASRMLRHIAENLGEWHGQQGVELGLMGEIRRLTNVLVPTANGWETMMYDDALTQELISAEDADEVEGIIVFFILNSALQRQQMKKTFIEAGARLWGAATTLLGLTEYRSFLSTSTEAATTNPPADSEQPEAATSDLILSSIPV